MATVQFRVDDELKENATKIYEDLGLDLSSALRMFMKKTVMVNGIPFQMYVSDEPFNKEKMQEALDDMRRISKENGNDKLTLDEINEIIAEVRRERRNKQWNILQSLILMFWFHRWLRIILFLAKLLT